MSDEQDFWNAILAEPLNFHRIAIFADWLQDRDDPRAEGIRAIARFGIVPYDTITRPRTLLWCVSSYPGSYTFPATICRNEEFNKCARAMLPQEWYNRIVWGTMGHGWHNARVGAYNAIALAYRPEEHP